MIHTTIIPTHTLANWLLTNIDRLLDAIGLHRYQTLEEIIYFLIIIVASYFIGWIVKKIILLFTQKFVKLANSPTGRTLLQQHTFTRCSHFIPPLVFLSLAPFAFDDHSGFVPIVIKLSWAYLCCTVAIGINAVLAFAFSRYNEKENTKNLPLKGILNVAEGLVWMIMVIIAISVIVHKSPAALLGGMTAFAAVLMLVFKDSILGFVAGIQMSQNDMLHVGDWIVVPSTLANGVVEDVSLTTVKVRNFDNTLVMVPPYTLVSTSFQNWRGMKETGMRRVASEIYINPETIVTASADFLDAMGKKYAQLQDFINGLRQKGATVAWDAGSEPHNGTIETNIGLFRAYLVNYLLASPMVNHTSDLMVRIMPMSAQGVPLQLYFFAITTQWESYEGIMSAVLEHALVTAPQFGLEILSSQQLNINTLPAK